MQVRNPQLAMDGEQQQIMLKHNVTLVVSPAHLIIIIKNLIVWCALNNLHSQMILHRVNIFIECFYMQQCMYTTYYNLDETIAQDQQTLDCGRVSVRVTVQNPGHVQV